MLNKCMIHGRLTKDPEIRYSQNANSTAVARFTIACDRDYKRDGEQNADFITCVAFGKTAEHISKYFTKGKQIIADGRIQTGSYQNRDGATVYTTDLVAERVYFCGDNNQNTAQRPQTTDTGVNSRNGNNYTTTHEPSPFDAPRGSQMGMNDGYPPMGEEFEQDQDLPF